MPTDNEGSIYSIIINIDMWCGIKLTNIKRDFFIKYK